MNSSESPLIRLAPLQPGELPSHPSFTSPDSELSQPRPELLPFLLALLDDGYSLLDPNVFNLKFKRHSSKSSPPSNTEVEVLSRTVPLATLSDSSKVPWNSGPVVKRSKPRGLTAEFWYARRSQHKDVSVKISGGSSASWKEFVFGIRDNHLKNESEFTPTIYDAREVMNWNEQIRALEAQGGGLASGVSEARNRKTQPLQSPGTGTGADAPEVTNSNHVKQGFSYTDVTLAAYEMCHEMPSPLDPRCFPVLVATASITADEFIAVTVPVNLSTIQPAFYSNGRNVREGTTSLRKKDVIVGGYTAVEKVSRYQVEKGEAKGDGEIEWVMATASDAKGNVPTFLQRMGTPGAIVKDVGLFLKWIKNVPEEEIGARP